MIGAYVEALIDQTLERVRVLKGKIKNPLPSAEFTGLVSRCEGRLDELCQRLNYLLNDLDIKRTENLGIRLRILRRAIEDLAQLEYTGIAALNRSTCDDTFMNKLLFEIYSEIKYPLNPPVVTCLSQSYYVIYPFIGLLAVPLAESDFLLHLPDLYHEMSHPLLSATNDPRIEKFQREFNKFINIVQFKFNKRYNEISRQTGPKDYLLFEAKTLEISWVKYWSMELFCDLFATYTLGYAYAWAHLHLTASNDADPFAVRIGEVSSHPPDQARMEVILEALNLIGHQQEAKEIQKRWNELLIISGSKQEPTYRKACPRELLEQIVVLALEGTKAIGCRIAEIDAKGYIHTLLNEAWRTFWKDPSKYLEWEKGQVKNLKGKYSTA